MDPNEATNHVLRNCSTCLEGISRHDYSIAKLIQARNELERALHAIILLIEGYRA